jgi:hypothetical protein
MSQGLRAARTGEWPTCIPGMECNLCDVPVILSRTRPFQTRSVCVSMLDWRRTNCPRGFVSSAEAPVAVDLEGVESMAGQAVSRAAEAGLQAAGRFLNTFDFFNGAWLLNMLFLAVVATLLYSLIVLGPKQ